MSERLRTRFRLFQSLVFTLILTGYSVLGCAGDGGNSQNRAPGTSPGDSNSSGADGASNGASGSTGGAGGDGGSSGDGGGSSLGSIELVRDTHGVVHVYAPTDAAAFYGSGYAMARDRLFQMELNRRRALGTSAELFGEDAVKADIGARAFDFGVLGAADLAALRASAPEGAELVQAWVDGINLFITQVKSGAIPRPYGFGAGELDFVPEPWRLEEPFAIGKMITFGLSNNLDQDVLNTAIQELTPGFDVPVALPAFDAFTMQPEPTSHNRAQRVSLPRRTFNTAEQQALHAAFRKSWHYVFPNAESNNWAVSGEHTTTGMPLLAGDPHQPTASPNVLYPFHMNSKDHGGTLDVLGFAFVGTPTVELGHNDKLGWTATTNFADVMDMWSVAIDNGQAVLAGTRVTVEKRNVPIRVRAEGQKVGEGSIQMVELSRVPGYGILLPDALLPIPKIILTGDVFDDGILFNWTGFLPTTETLAYLGMDRAKNLDELEQAVEHIGVGAMNFVAASAEGIVYKVNAKIPDRGTVGDKDTPYRIQKSVRADNLWTGSYLAKDKLPYMRDPASGFIATANNDPFGFTRDGDVTNDPYYYGSFYARGFRAHRIMNELKSMVASGEKLDEQAMMALQADVHSPLADVLMPHLQLALESVPSDRKLKDYRDDTELLTLAQELLSWKREIRRESGAALAFTVWTWLMVDKAFASKLTLNLVLEKVDLFDPIADKNPPFLLGQLVNVMEARFEGAEDYVPDGRSVFLLEALDATRDLLKQRYGKTDLSALRYDMLHAASFANKLKGKLDLGRLPVDGGTDTINVSPASFFEKGKPRTEMTSDEAAAYRMVLTFTEDGSPRGFFNYQRGVSGEPNSAHFADLHSDWTEARYVRWPFTRAEVEAAVESREMLALP